MAKSILRWEDDAGSEHLILVDLVTDLELTDGSEVTEHAIEDGSLAHDHQIQSPLMLSLEILQSNQPISTEETGFEYVSKDLSFLTVSTIEESHRLEIRPVQTAVLSPFLLAGQAVGAAIDSAAGALGGALGVTIPDGKTVTLHKGQKGSSNNLKMSRLAGSGDDRVMALWNDLRAAKAASRFLALTVRGHEIASLLLTRIGLKHKSGETGAGRFSVELKQINVVATEVVALPVPKLAKKKSGGAKGNKDVSSGNSAGNSAGADSANQKGDQQLESLLFQMLQGGS